MPSKMGWLGLLTGAGRQLTLAGVQGRDAAQVGVGQRGRVLISMSATTVAENTDSRNWSRADPKPRGH